MQQNKSIWKTLREYIVITLGLAGYVLGWTIFLVPNNLVGGGVTGIASIVQYATHGFIKIGTTYFVLNLFLLVAALFTLGRSFGGKTVYAIIITSLGLSACQEWFYSNPGAMEFIQTMAVDNGKLICTIIGGLLSGLGIGMAMSVGGSTGGTDIIALIVNKYRDVSPGRMLLMLDLVIIGSSLLVPSYTSTGELLPFSEKVTTVVYGWILITVSSYVLDLYLAGVKQSVQIVIFSKKYEAIADALVNDIHRGVTVLDGKGWYTKQSQPVIMVLARKTDLNIILHCVKSIDSDAFLSVSSTTGVYGRGFEMLRK